MKIFLTGGSGFIGGRVIHKLVERGHEVHALARSERSAAIVQSLGAQAYRGDVTNKESMREGMQGCDAVFHIAAWYEIGTQDQAQAVAVNVEGTRHVLELAHELDIPKIIYTSTIAVYGDTKWKLVDETFYQGGPFLTEYDRTKWIAHYKVAQELKKAGVPIITVMPGAVYGPGDTSVIASIMRSFYRGLLPVMPTPGTTLTFAHVEDIAEGHILAWEKGHVGEDYIIAGPVMTLREVMSLWSSLTGRATPLFHVPGSMMRRMAPISGALSRYLPVPDIYSADACNITEATYTAHAEKARRELGWTPRPLVAGMEETLDWIAQTTPQPPVLHTRPRQIAAFSLLAGVLALFGWLLGRRCRRGCSCRRCR